jgi:hypothetical protein
MFHCIGRTASSNIMMPSSGPQSMKFPKPRFMRCSCVSKRITASQLSNTASIERCFSDIRRATGDCLSIFQDFEFPLVQLWDFH